MTEDAIMMGILYNFGKFSAPAFIFITGFILFHRKKSSIPYGRFIMDKTADVIFPFVFWTLIYFTLITDEALFSQGWFIGLSKSTVLGSAAPHLWYVVMVFQFHLLYPLFIKLFDKIESSHNKFGPLRLFLVFGLLYLALMDFSYRHIFNGQLLTDVGWLIYTDRSFLAYSFYFIMGGYAALHLPKWRKFVHQSVPINTFLFLTLFIWVGYELIGFSGVYDGQLSASTYLKPSMFLYVVSEIILLYSLSIMISRSRTPLFAIIHFFGQFSFGAFLSHFLWLMGVLKVFNQLNSDMNVFAQAGMIFGFTSLFSVTFAYLISGSPFSRLLIGHFDRLQVNLGKHLNFHQSPSIRQKK